MRNSRKNKKYNSLHGKFAEDLMTSNVPTVHIDAKVVDVENLLIRSIKKFDSVHYVYVLNDEHILKGVISVKEIFRLTKTAKVKEKMIRKVVSVRSNALKQHIVYLALKHNIISIPVVDKDNHFLGAVPSNTILKILDNHSVENIFRFGGLSHFGAVDDINHISLRTSLKHRLPWLILGLVGGLLSAQIVQGFEETLSTNLILAAFIPLIVYMASAVSAQMLVFIVRDFSIDPRLRFVKYVLRQVAVVIGIGIVTSLLLFVLSYLFYGVYNISLVLGIALFLATLSSMFTGLFIPYFFSKLKLDPANASGPIATIIQDIISLMIYFLTAFWIL